MQSIMQIADMLLGVAKFIIFAHVIMSWLINFNVINPYNGFVRQIWVGLATLLEPVYGRIRAFLPPMGGLDLAPLVALLAVIMLQILIRNNMPVTYL